MTSEDAKKSDRGSDISDEEESEFEMLQNEELTSDNEDEIQGLVREYLKKYLSKMLEKEREKRAKEIKQ